MDRLAIIEANMIKIQEAQLRLEASQIKTDQHISELKASQLKTDAQLAKTDAQLAKTDSKLWSIGVNLGHTAEEFFYYALQENLQINHVKFDEISLNIKGKNKQVEDEFDIVLYNGNTIALVEIKHKVHPTDIDKLITKKLPNFKILFPDYANYNFYLGIGGMSVPLEVAKQAKNKGMLVFRQKGELADIDADNLIYF